jgi:hypothetical protein
VTGGIASIHARTAAISSRLGRRFTVAGGISPSVIRR